MNFLRKITGNVFKNISNIPGWNTNRKIIVFEVDDWGAIRTRSRAARDRMIDAGLKLESNRFNYYDTLASKEDLQALYDTLLKHKDFKGNPAIFTAVSVVANPDFDKIRESEFREYHFETLNVTLASYFGNNDVLELWKEGIRMGVFYPEFHGKEHLNTELWLKALQSKDKLLLSAFDNYSIGVRSNILKSFKGGYLSAFDFESSEAFIEQKKSIKDGLSIFNNLFGYKANHFTSSGLIHHPDIEQTLREEGVKYIDVAKKHIEPQGNGVYKTKYYKLGELNKHDQIYITRNSRFEPNDNSQNDWVNSTLKDIEIAFKWKKPAIISSHRVNFVGGIELDNRIKGISNLDDLLKNIIKKWPDVEFMSVSQLGNLIMGQDTIHD